VPSPDTRPAEGYRSAVAFRSQRERESSGNVLSRLARTFDPSTLRGHFVLARTIPLLPDGWSVQSLDGWHLATEPSLPVVELVAADGDPLGWLLGRPIELGRGLCRSPLRVPLAVADAGFETRFEEWLFSHAGSFVAVLLRPAPLLFVDTFGALPVLFDRSLEAASSSPFLLTEDGTVPDSEIAAAIDILGSGRWFILGSSPHGRADRLLPNHLLDLRSWVARRHWPAGAIEPGDPDTLIAGMCDAIENAMLAAAAESPPNVSLTAGADSRLLLACLRAHVDRVRFFTVVFPDRLGDTDRRTAPRIAARFGLAHQSLEWIPPTTADVDRFLYMTGCLVGELRGRQAGPTYAQLGGTAPYVSGVGTITVKPAAEVDLTASGAERSPTDAAWLLRYFWFPELPELMARAERWLEEAPPLDAHNLRVLYHLENRYGCWGGALALGYPEADTYTLYPFGQRAVADAIFSLPLDHRLAGRARRDATLLRWPELLEIPVNRPTRRVAVANKISYGWELEVAAVRRLGKYGRLAGRRAAHLLGLLRSI
jgi:hypothetical protein